MHNTPANVASAIRYNPNRHLESGHGNYVAIPLAFETTPQRHFAVEGHVRLIIYGLPIKEHKMIAKAVRSGVKPERIAAALNIPITNVQASLNLLNGIHDEPADLMKGKAISPKASRAG